MSCAKAADDHYDDEVLSSPYAKVSLNPQTEQIINCAMGLKHPIDVISLKKAFSDSVMVQHPRFCSLVVRDHGRVSWRKTRVNVDDHFIVVDSSTTGSIEDDVVEASVNAYLADLAALSTRLSDDKPLWEVHVLLGLNCVVLRVHHCICDGASLMSMLSACFGKKKDGNGMKKDVVKIRKWRKGGVWGLVKSGFLTCLFMHKVAGKVSFVKDEKTKISGGDGVERFPKKFETLKFEIQDFNFVKKAIPNAELSELMRPKSRWYGSSSWGNKSSLVVLPIHISCNELHPLEHIKKMKAIMDQKKQSYEAQLFYIFAQFFFSCLGLKATAWMTYRGTCNTTLTISNIVGPSEEMAIANNPITYLRVNISSLPQAVVIYIVSYAGKIDLQVMVAKDIIPDSQFLAECFRESLLEMKGCIRVGEK